jgi:hypothetical protein
MTKQSYVASAVPTRRPEVILSALPLPGAADHDEWLLDEALAETFPASDPIAVSPYSLAPDKPI